MELKRLDWILIKAREMILTPWEETFIKDLTERREKYGDDITITIKR
jgi:hypothetical protein